MEVKVVLITGASAGIGYEAALQLMDKGVKVYAASRRGGISQKAISGPGEIIHVKMDVNVEADIAAVIKQILSENGQLDAIVCNAGNGIAGSIEDTSIDEVRYQFETNFFGVVKTIQACLPVFRKQGHGKIITVSSLAGVIPIPFQTFYSSVKAALLLFMNGLSIEMKPFGIQCCTILPGDTKTEFTAARKYTEASQNEKSVYSRTLKRSVGRMEKDEQNGMTAASVAKSIVNEVLAKKMRSYYVPGFINQVFYHLFNALPTNLRLWIIAQLYG